MIQIDGLGVAYGTRAVLDDVSAVVEEGELCLVVGPTGSGKSTLLGAVSARVPHLTGGTVTGTVRVAGRDTRTHRPRDLADVVGVVGQDPLATFVTDVVEDELAFAMEQLGVPPVLMRRRVEEVLDLLGLADLRSRQLSTLSGGEQQRVAIGAVLTAQPRVLVLDEPTSALDPGAAEDVLAALARLVHDAGVTVLLAEHRLERVVGFADRVIALDGGRAQVGDPAAVLATAAVAPPVVELGRAAGWDPVPLTVREARRRSAGLRERLGSPESAQAGRTADDADAAVPVDRAAAPLRAERLRVTYGPMVALAGVDVSVPAGVVTAVMGRNGAGKSSLLWALAGAQKSSGGRVRGSATRRDGSDGSDGTVRTGVALVPQSPEDLLYLLTVAQECRTADEAAARPAGATRTVLDRLLPGVPEEANPRDLSEGQRLALAVAIQLVREPEVLLLDEPTRGLDYISKRHLVMMLRELAAQGRGVLVATHDVEFAAQVAHRVVQLAAGEVVAEGPARAVLADSALFAPQVAKVLSPAPWLTVDEVRAALPGDLGSSR
ncbi:ABC transporter ATP-binding protein [Ruania halotolerans]|uniref:ABC transporter ATP-binding protein n=1 Tax=Ruania halotolerans TaxID=2897773 RepID=UPI001E5BD19D|nr:ABC transporter ATP-binding protein [Ruania halotolerans]UFU07710.1 ATP-binding cassette domain-containing protein [Ruania halotolerans]